MTVPVILFPRGVDTMGNEAVWFVPAIANPAAPTVAELNAGVPLQCAITTFSPTAEQGTVSDTRLCTREEFEVLGRTKVSIDALEYVWDPQDPSATTSTEYRYVTMMTEGTQGYVVDRRGIAHETAWAAGQYVSVYPVTAGAQVDVPVEGGAEGQKFKITQKLAVSGPSNRNVTVVA